MSKGVYKFATNLFSAIKISVIFLITSILGILFVNSNVHILRNKLERKKIVKDFLPCIVIELYILLLIYFNLQMWFILGNDLVGMFMKLALLCISITYSTLLIVVYAKTEDNLVSTFRNSFIIMVHNLGKTVILGMIIAILVVLTFKLSTLLVLLVLPGIVVMLQNKIVYPEVKKYYKVIE